jgi:flagellar protein FliS
MSYATQAASYRDMEIQAATSEKLLCIVFDQLVINLERARFAIEKKDIEQRVVSLRRARNLVTELLSTLDFEKGGKLANDLADLYQFMLVELVDVGIREDAVTTGKLVNIAKQLREGFVGAAEQLLRSKQLKTA